MIDVLFITPLIIVVAISVKFIPVTWIIFPLDVIWIVFYLESVNSPGSKLASIVTRVCVVLMKLAAIAFAAQFVF